MSLQPESSILTGKKILFVFGNLELGGAERQGLLLASHLKDKVGAEVQVWGLSPYYGTLSDLCSAINMPWEGFAFNWKFPYRHMSLLKLGIRLHRESPDILVSYTTLPNIACSVVRRIAGAKVNVWNQADAGLILNDSFLHRYAVQQTAVFISNSACGKEFLVTGYRLDPGRIWHIPNGVELDVPKHDRISWRCNLGLDDDQVAVCMLANLTAYKDHATLLTAWHKVVSSNPDVRLFLAGRCDGEENTIKELISKFNLGCHVQLLGEVSDVAGLLDAMDLLAHSSRSEGCPNALLEGMLAGLPVVATDIPGIREALGSDCERFLAPPGDADAFATKILELVGDPELRVTVGEQLRHRAQLEFSLSRMLSLSVECLESVLQ
ncbi:glycosyltransferase family 4 protein [Geobacter sp. OR-1]|uniref:glycosyltransferase family 4 protein n=1 Tax=Geobacter sp. OR-1 TaxID=1266765 RepID=UPI0005AB22A7|nr:glycosyltransferase family 4 protein [Geobacter sp. OR-1]